MYFFMRLAYCSKIQTHSMVEITLRGIFQYLMNGWTLMITLLRTQIVDPSDGLNDNASNDDQGADFESLI